MNQAAEIAAVEHAEESQHQSSEVANELRAAFQLQRKAYLENPVPSLEQRREDLKGLKRLLSENLDAIVEAIGEDYGNRSRHEVNAVTPETSERDEHGARLNTA